jgi:serine O-acetyltransferase
VTPELSAATAEEGPAIVITPPSSWDTRHLRGLLGVLHEDIAVNGSLLTPGTQMLAHHRFGTWLDDPRRHRFVRALGTILYRVTYPYVRNIIGFEVPRTAKIGRRVKFVHQHGVTIHPHAEIGDDCLIRHNVTIGLRWDASRPGPFNPPPPRIGARVQFGVSTTIIGGVRIGDDAVLGALTIVTKDVPAGASVVPAASRVLRLRGDDAD